MAFSLAVCVLLLIVPSLINGNPRETESNLDIKKEVNAVKQPESSWIIESYIHIDGSISNNWSLTRQNKPWCTSGDGSKGDPYIIDNAKIDRGTSGSCIYIQNSQVYFEIKNCRCYNSGSGIRLNNVGNATLSNNNCSENTGYGIVLESSNENVIKNNLIKDNGNWGLHLNNYNDRNKIIGNEIINNFEYGIRLRESEHNLIHENHVAESSDYGIFILTNSFNNNITNNNASHNDNIGIYVGEDNNLVRHNTMNYNTGNEGLLLGGDGIHVNNNTMMYNRDGLVLLGADNNYIRGNFMMKNTRHGTWLTSACNGNQFQGNIFDDNSGSNVDDDGSGNSYKWNEFDGSTIEPLTIDDDGGGDFSWEQCRFYMAWCRGTGTEDNPYTFKNAKFNGGNTQSCLTIRDTSVHFEVAGCKTYNSGPDANHGGIVLENVQNGKLNDNNCSANNNTGILVSKNSQHNEIMNNLISNNNKSGIIVNASHFNVLRNNTIKTNTHGILLNRTHDNNLTDNYVHDNLKDGVLLYKSKNTTIDDNNCSSNPRNGINLLASNYTQILGNIFDSNALHGIIANGTLTGSNNNTIHSNYFWNNHEHARDLGTDNKWNCSEIGNYWDNYTGADVNPKDGIGDTPHEFRKSATDYLPKAAPMILSISPEENSLYALTPPTLTISYIEPYLDELWYGILGGSKNITIEQDKFTVDGGLWNEFGNGSLTIRVFINDTLGKENYRDLLLRKDIIKPDVNITSPTPSTLFGSEAPAYTVLIDEPDLHMKWYTLDDGKTNITFTANQGKLSQDAWNAAGNGAVKITFHANDTLSNHGNHSIVVYKDTIAPEIKILTPTNQSEVSTSYLNYSVSITDAYSTRLWYTVNNGTKISFSNLTGKINQSIWKNLPEGECIIRFYANDTMGNVGMNSTTIVKAIPEEENDDTGEDEPFWNATTITIIVIIGASAGGVAIILGILMKTGRLQFKKPS